jgi:hypothetical protein
MENKTNLPEDKSVKLENQPDLGLYPELTQESLSMYINDIKNLARMVVQDDIDSTSNTKNKEFTKFLTLVQNISLRNKDFATLMQGWKVALVAMNRTTALTSAFTTGVAIGTFLSCPHLALDFTDSTNDEKGEEDVD